jgi:multicomponent Na+:H+ antiporter subunit D
MLLGVAMAIIQTDFKRLIAFGAVAEIGYILLGIGTGLVVMLNPEMTATGLAAMNGGIFHIMNDALDVGLLFLVAGAIYYATKETSLNKLGGLARNMKYTTVFFIIGLLAISGMPPMNGFASKLLIYESTYQLNPILSIIAILSSIMLLAIFVKVFHSAFLGPALPKFENVKEVPKSMLIAMGTIATIIIIFGLFPELIVNNIVEPAANALINYGDYVREVIPSFTGGA